MHACMYIYMVIETVEVFRHLYYQQTCSPDCHLNYHNILIYFHKFVSLY